MPTYKRLTKSPRAGNKYRIAIDGIPVPGPQGLLTKSEILSLGLELLEEGRTFSLGHPMTSSPPKKSSEQKHPSKYRTKHR